MFSGLNFLFLKISVSGELCLAEAECTHWSWHHLNFPDPAQQLFCCLKKTSDSSDPDFVNAIEDCGIVSGIKSCNDDTKVQNKSTNGEKLSTDL